MTLTTYLLGVFTLALWFTFGLTGDAGWGSTAGVWTVLLILIVSEKSS